MRGVDLNCVGHFSGLSRGGAHARRQDPVRPTHGLRALDEVHADRHTLRRGSSGAAADLRRTVPGDVLCAVDPPGNIGSSTFQVDWKRSPRGAVFVKIVVRQGHAASVILGASLSRSGLSRRSPIGVQLRGFPDHRSDLAARAFAHREARWASTAGSCCQYRRTSN